MVIGNSGLEFRREVKVRTGDKDLGVSIVFVSSRRSCRSSCVFVLVSQLCPTLCDPMNCSSPGSSVHGILQARIQDWVAISFSRGSSRPIEPVSRHGNWARVSCIGRWILYYWVTREVPQVYLGNNKTIKLGRVILAHCWHKQRALTSIWKLIWPGTGNRI